MGDVWVVSLFLISYCFGFFIVFFVGFVFFLVNFKWWRDWKLFENWVFECDRFYSVCLGCYGYLNGGLDMVGFRVCEVGEVVLMFYGEYRGVRFGEWNWRVIECVEEVENFEFFEILLLDGRYIFGVIVRSICCCEFIGFEFVEICF